MSRKKPIQVSYETLVVIWLSLLMSQFLFVAVVWFVKPNLFTFDTSRSFFGEMPLVTLVFAASASLFLILSFVLSRQYVRRAVEDQDAGCVQTGLLLGCALSEVASLLGLILAFAFDHPYFYVWIAFGMLGILLHFPRKGNLEAATYKLR
jgi:hypothetical protein